MKNLKNYNIAIIGFMATGKTVIGKELAERLNRKHIDIDSYIEKQEGISIREIFKKNGEDYFRKLERKATKEISLLQDLIISCGGGLVLKPANIIDLKKKSKIILLEASPLEILNRSKDDKSRPLLDGKDRLKEIEILMDKREPYYRDPADMVINTRGKDISTIVDEIVEGLEIEKKDKALRIEPKALGGSLTPPPSKSLAHRAIIASSLSLGKSNIGNVSFSDDIIATITNMKELGIDIKRDSGCGFKRGDSLKISGGSLKELRGEILNCKESGSTLRFLIPIALLKGERVIFDGEGKLRDRPLDPYYEIFDRQGIRYKTDGGSLPLEIDGRLRRGDFRIDGGISSQFITGLLFALPLLEGDSKIEIIGNLESKAYVDLTIDILGKYGIDIKRDAYKEFMIKGNQEYKAFDYKVEADYSQAAFWIVAGILGGDIELQGLKLDSLQGDSEIINLVEKMGGSFKFNKSRASKESSMIVKKSNTHGISIDGSNVPDIVPILTVLAALSEGETKITNIGRLRIKESDRIKAISTELNKLGADVRATSDSLEIRGKKHLKGGIVDSWNDHRIAMALAIASIGTKGDVIIKRSHVVNKSYPNFWEDFKILGGKIDEFDMGR